MAEQDRLDLFKFKNYDTFGRNIFSASMSRPSEVGQQAETVPIVYVIDGQPVYRTYNEIESNEKLKTYKKYIWIGFITVVILLLVILSIFLFYYFHNTDKRSSTGNFNLKDYANYTNGNCSSYKCGQSSVHSKQLRIVGGQTVAPYAWPWQVALFKLSGTGYYLTCGASLISDQWILTAAHCFQYDQNPQNFLVKLGVFNKNANDEPGEMVLKVADILLHPNFDTTFMYNDIALIKLYFPIQCNDHIIPACLPYQYDPLPPVGTLLTVTGWGTTQVGNGMTSTTLRKVSVPLISEKACKFTYGYNTVSYSYSFCAGYIDGGRDTCQGDSGGPIVYQNYDQWIQLGITSWGNGCAEALKPGVYSRVSTYVDWIQSYTNVQHVETT